MTANRRETTIAFEGSNNPRIDKYLATLKHDELYSRSQIEKLIKDGSVTVNGSLVKKNYKLEQNDSIHIVFPIPEPTEVIPQDIPLNIIYEDDYLAVINKPIGLVVHPGTGNRENTLVHGLVHHFKENLSNGSDKLRPGIVHRLDKDTSGVLIVAKEDRTHSLLQTMFMNKEIKKTYRAICVGTPKQSSGTIETFLERDPGNPIKIRTAESGKWSVTHYEILKYFHYFTYLDIDLETGRTHQIRVHLSSLNLPILGDRLYNSAEVTSTRIQPNYRKKLKNLLEKHLPVQALHAYKIAFKHPITGDDMEFKAPLPKHFEYALKWLEENFALDEQ